MAAVLVRVCGPPPRAGAEGGEQMTESPLHVVYREEQVAPGELNWHSDSLPTAVHVGGYTLEDARGRFREAAAFLCDGQALPPMAEHLERQVTDGVFVRVAVDRHSLDREYVRASLATALAQPVGFRPEFAEVAVAATGDHIVVCCVGTDLLGWVFEQMSDHDVLHVALAAGEVGVALTAIAGPAVAAASAEAPTLAGIGLTAESTVGEFVHAVAADREVSVRPVLVSSAA